MTGGLSLELLTPATIGSGNEPRTDNFRPDIEVPRESRSTPKDYEKSGFDKGHLASAGDMREDGVSMSQSFFMSNMAPQYPANNRGIWYGLERRVRTWVVGSNRNLYVMTGTIFQEPVTKLKGRVGIPALFFKVIIDKDRGDAVAYMIPNNPGSYMKLDDYRFTIADVQKMIGYDLLPDASQAVKAKLLTATGSSFPSIR